ncbi:MAG: M24 family metallopeptidase [Rhodospirillales bacterium]
MRKAWAAVLVAVCVYAAGIPNEEYRARRQKVRSELGDAVLVLFGNTERDVAGLRHAFVQEPNFYYLTGWLEPNAILLLTPDTEMLFLPPRDPASERYTGRKIAPGDESATEATGFEKVLPAAQFEAQFKRALESRTSVYTLPGTSGAEKLKSLAPLREFRDAVPMLARHRAVKSKREIEMIRRSVDATVEAHRAAWRRIAPGLYEYQVAATMTFAMQDNECERNAYAPIVGSGPSALVLHYAKNSRKMDAGELVLMDVGAECSAYAADVTRTVPVSGRFTPRQRELYEVVLGAQKAVLAAIKPGVIMGANRTAPNSLYKVAYDYLNEHGKDAKGNPLGKYLTHGVSHHVGLQVHDAPAASYSQPLEAGMVITVEPGIYIPEESIGIRIEDTVLVTPDGAEVLSAALPKEPDEIEKAMAAR